ncbi:MAG TPA: hypothetical protein VF755_00480 [Catenuloplanes sp.]
MTGLLASGALVWQASSAAFTASTTNPGNTWSAGTVAMSDSLGGPTAGTAMFSPSAQLVPGSSANACIDVTFTGNVASTVKLYSNDPTGSLGLYLTMKIEEGATSTTCGAATGWTLLANQTLEAFYAAPRTSWTNGVSTWAPSATATRRFKFTYTLEDNPSAQSQTTSVTYTWEVRST